GSGFVNASQLRSTISNELVISAEVCDWRDRGPVSYSLVSLLGKHPAGVWLKEQNGTTAADRFPHGFALSAIGGDYVARVWSALSQSRFLSMLTIWFFYDAISVRPLHRAYLSAASVAFCLTYLSWEGTASLLPAFLIGLMVVRPGEWWWLKEFHLYRCLFFIVVVVI